MSKCMNHLCIIFNLSQKLFHLQIYQNLNLGDVFKKITVDNHLLYIFCILFSLFCKCQSDIIHSGNVIIIFKSNLSVLCQY